MKRILREFVRSDFTKGQDQHRALFAVPADVASLLGLEADRVRLPLPPLPRSPGRQKARWLHWRSSDPGGLQKDQPRRQRGAGHEGKNKGSSAR